MKETDQQNIEEIDVEDIGTILKSSRLKSKKSLEEISSELCIRKIYLTALEESNYEVLPPVPYGIGYVRTYARYLGLSPERAVKLYKTAALAVEEQNEEEVVTVPEANKSGNRHVFVGILALAVISGGWSWYVSQSSSKTSDERVVSATVVEDANKGLEKTVSPKEQIQPENTTEEKTGELTIVTEEISSTTDEDTSSEVADAEPVVEETPEIVKNNVVLEFTGETWIELKDKKKVYFQGVFHKGDRKEINYTDNLFLSVGRPRNVKVFIKGIEKDIVAPRRKMNIPLDSLN